MLGYFCDSNLDLDQMIKPLAEVSDVRFWLLADSFGSGDLCLFYP